MSDGYPTKECINEIRKWRHGKEIAFTKENVEKLLDTLEQNNRFPEWSIDYALECDCCENIVVVLYYSTGGWSGHEEQIDELQKTFFWALCWEQSRRGGHYKFSINPECFWKKNNIGREW